MTTKFCAVLWFLLGLTVACSKKDETAGARPVDFPSQLSGATNAELQAKYGAAAVYDFEQDGVEHKVLVVAEAPPTGYAIAFYGRSGEVLTALRGIHHISSDAVPRLDVENGQPFVRTIRTGDEIPQRLEVRGDDVVLGVDETALERKLGTPVHVRETVIGGPGEEGAPTP